MLPVFHAFHVFHVSVISGGIPTLLCVCVFYILNQRRMRAFVFFHPHGCMVLILLRHTPVACVCVCVRATAETLLAPKRPFLPPISRNFRLLLSLHLINQLRRRLSCRLLRLFRRHSIPFFHLQSLRLFRLLLPATHVPPKPARLLRCLYRLGGCRRRGRRRRSRRRLLGGRCFRGRTWATRQAEGERETHNTLHNECTHTRFEQSTAVHIYRCTDVQMYRYTEYSCTECRSPAHGPYTL